MAFAFRLNYVDVICDNSLKNTYTNSKKNGFEFDVRLSYYRGLFLSCIDKLELFVNDEKVCDSDITFCLNNKEFSVNQLPHLISEFWQLTEPAKILVRKPNGLPLGKHHIKLDLMLRVPYLPLPGADGQRIYMPLDSCGEKTFELSESNGKEVNL